MVERKDVVLSADVWRVVIGTEGDCEPEAVVLVLLLFPSEAVTVSV